jgi:hypothetical protein
MHIILIAAQMIQEAIKPKTLNETIEDHEYEMAED